MADDGAYRRMLVVTLPACAVQPVLWIVQAATTTEPLFPDFFGLWSFGRYVLTHAPETIYDSQALAAFQIGLGMPEQGGHYAFYYPPWILILLAPVGLLPYSVARVAWLVLTFAAYVAATGAWRWQKRLVGLLCLAPSSAVCLLLGQNGFLTAALMLGGLQLLRTRAAAAGLLLGAVAYKPQFAVLIPFLLLFGRHWRALAGAGLSAGILTLITTLLFGGGLWTAWVTSLQADSGTLTTGRAALLDLMPTVMSAVQLLGGTAIARWLTQATCMIVALMALWRVRGRHDPTARAVLPLVTILSTPYGFHYDLPMITGAVLSILDERMRADGHFAGLAFPWMIAAVMVPAILPAHPGGFAAAVPAVFAGALWLASGWGQQRPDPVRAGSGRLQAAGDSTLSAM